MARYYRMDYEAQRNTLTWQEDGEKKNIAKKLGRRLCAEDRPAGPSRGGDRRTYILLTRVEAAFRAMKSPLLERPISTIWKSARKRISSSVSWPTICW